MDNFPRSSDGDMSLSCNPVPATGFYNQQIGHVAQNTDQSVVSSGQYMGDHITNAGMMPNVPNYSGMANGGVVNHLPNQIRSNSPIVIESQYQLSTAGLPAQAAQQAPMIQHGMMPQLIPNGSSGPDGDNNSYHGMVGHNVGHNMNGYYNPGQNNAGGSMLLSSNTMVGSHGAPSHPTTNFMQSHPHQGMLLAQQQPQALNNVNVGSDAYGRQQLFMHQPGMQPNNAGGQNTGNPQPLQMGIPQGQISGIPQQQAPLLVPGTYQQGNPHALQGGHQQQPAVIPQGGYQVHQQQMNQGIHAQQAGRQLVPPGHSASVGAANRAPPPRKNWQSGDADAPHRKLISEKIVTLLQQRKQHTAADWHEKLPTMAKRLEEALYNQATSLEMYLDESTLKNRLQQLAVQMGNKQASKHQNQNQAASGPPQHQTGPSQQFQPQSQQMMNQHHQQMQPMQNQPAPGTGQYAGQVQQYYSQPQGQHQQGVRQPQQMGQYNSNMVPVGMVSGMNVGGYNAAPMNYSVDPNISQPQMQSHMSVNSDGSDAHNMPHGYQPNMHHQNQQSGNMAQQQSQQQPQQAPRQMMININQINPLASGQPAPQQLGQSSQGRTAGTGTNGTAVGNGSGGGHGHGAQSDDHRMQVLKQQQQRLLLLRHASKCPYENGRCRITPLCASMKQLWKHIMSCKDQECKMSHCVSSRYVLSHYSKCKDQNCPVCGPVRKAIKDNYEKSRTIIESAKDQRAVRLVDQKLLVRKQLQLDPVSCAIYCFTNEQIEAHVKTIHEGVRITAAKVKELFLPMLDEILRMPNCLSIFGSPVDPQLYNLPDYFTIIKSPMDLGTVRKKLDALQYRDTIFFVEDVHLTFDNAMLYNPKSSQIHQWAKTFRKEFDNKYKSVMAKYESTIENNRKDENACVICGETKLNFEPPVYYCNGRCGGQRIRRNAFFYSAANNNYHWCSNCFTELKDNQPIRLPDMTITKAELRDTKKKHQEEAQESWVQCDECSRWVHTICGLFNSRRNFGDDVSFICPNCLIVKRRSGGEHIMGAVTCKTKAADLPRCNMSDFIEARLMERLEQAYAETAARLGVAKSAVEKCPPLVLRQVSCIDKMQPTREGVRDRYSNKNYPIEFPCRVKCVTLFQNIDGQDVILFGMYVYEYGHKCPQPNQRRVYVSYLDSVHYLRPKRYRTVIYHEILVSYLEYVKRRGFHTAHIWSCPPSKGDDYILYCHPVDQKTPKTDKLQKWYADMLDECVQRGIACELTDLHTEYLVDPNYDATVLPYFEGDYWTTEAEVIITALKGEGGAALAGDDEEYEDETTEVGVKSKRKAKSKPKGNRATRSKSGVVAKTERDPVMAKLAAIIEPMKNTFFVARLYPKEYAERFAASRQAEIVSEEADGAESDSRRIEQQLQEDVSMPSVPVALTKVPAADDGNQQSEAVSNEDDFDQMAQCVGVQEREGSDAADDSKSDRGDPTPVSMAAFPDDISNAASPSPMPVQSQFSSSGNGDGGAVPEVKENIYSGAQAEAKDDEAEFKGRAAKRLRTEDTNESSSSVVKMEVSTPGQSSEVANAGAGAGAGGAAGHGAMIIKSEVEPPSNQFLQCLRDDTEDVDEVQESEHWDTRQAFLNLCQGNHYQFDQLRRGKHTSMMVLYLMHNPDAPKFLPNCNVCHKDILLGGRYRCETCDFDFCPECYSTQGSRIHSHPLRHLSGHGASGSDTHKLTEQERRDRQRNLLLHVELLVHATDCNDPTVCTVKNCAKMKDFVAHVKTCSQANKGCPICKRVNIILTVHARKCRKDNCRVLNCLKIRERYRDLALRQQQMDDRRRAMINEMYSTGGAGTGRQNSVDADE